ncbi:hypothetical protein WJX72_007531 [[Myrmecia] bisecta]|uniref:Uncharacterized protein n=1 Tax=[Myrmecia] bisecta TaxID=41462 RepID=A0AAW1P0G2_9CHLO
MYVDQRFLSPSTAGVTDLLLADAQPAPAPSVGAVNATEALAPSLSTGASLTALNATNPLAVELGQTLLPSAPAPAPQAPAVQVVSVPLPAFTGVQSCLPFNILVAPSGGPGQYAVALNATSDVADLLSLAIVNDTLLLETTGPFQTTAPIQLTVVLPATELQRLIVTSPISEVTVANTFTPPGLLVYAPAYAAQINLVNVQTPALVISTAGTGAIVANGTFGSVSVTADVDSLVFLIGVANGVNVNLGGDSRLLVSSNSDAVQIIGSTQGDSFVKYVLGTCSAQNPDPTAADACQQGAIPAPAIRPQWTCGIAADTNFTCAATQPTGAMFCYGLDCTG